MPATERIVNPCFWSAALHEGILPHVRRERVAGMVDEIEDLYRVVIGAWNNGDGEAMARPFAPDGTVIGFDGSVHSGRETIAANMNDIFRDHPTGRYVTKVEEIRSLGPDAALLRAIAGLVPPGQRRVNADVNAHHTVVGQRRDSRWELVLYQNTPAQFHGRPDLVEAMTAQLQEIVDNSGG
jgi:uncharacterized protein (TIGR02246 family)